MINYCLLVAYDGTDYLGWQKQPSGDKKGIQTILENAVAKMFAHSVSILASGRTDAGVHAYGQVVTFKSEKDIPDWNIKKGLNTLLPADIRIKEVKRVSLDFHPTYAAKEKTYRYRVAKENDDPFNYRCSGYYPFALDVQRMELGSRYLLGEHDFSAFCAQGSSVSSKIRKIYEVQIEEGNGEIFFDITGNGFLYKMVRIIVGTLLDVGRGHLEPEAVKEIIDSQDRDKASFTAQAKGLILMEVKY